MFARIFDDVSGKWVRFLPNGDTELTSDIASASIIYASQLDSHVRNYELEYLRGSLALQPCGQDGAPL